MKHVLIFATLVLSLAGCVYAGPAPGYYGPRYYGGYYAPAPVYYYGTNVPSTERALPNGAFGG